MICEKVKILKMKKMKKLIITMGIVLISLVGFSQAAPTQVYRIADANTAFGVNISVGKQVYNIATQELWIATSGVLSTAKLSDSAASFKIVNGAGTTNLGETVAGNTVTITSSTGTAVTIGSASTERAGLMTKEMFDEHVLNNGKFTNKQSDLSIVTTATTGTISNSDGTGVVLAAANTTEAGLMTAAQFTKLGAVADGAQVNFTLLTEKFEETSGSALTHSLAHTAQTVGCNVSLNGAILNPADYTLTASTIKINLPVTQYDIVVVTYNY